MGAVTGRAPVGGRKPVGLCSWPDPGAKFPTSAYGVQSAGNPAAGGQPFTPTSPRCRGRPEVPGSGGGERHMEEGRPWRGGTAAVPTGHPDVLGGHPQDVSARQGGAWEANLGFQGQGEGGGSQPPLKPP